MLRTPYTDRLRQQHPTQQPSNVPVDLRPATSHQEVYTLPPQSSPWGISVVPGLLASFLTVLGYVYLHLLVRLPAFYFSRVSNVLNDARLSAHDMEAMALSSAEDWKKFSNQRNGLLPLAASHGKWAVTPTLAHFKDSWEEFIGSLLREWKTLNIIAVLLISAILTLLQIDASASQSVTRTMALLSLICAVFALSYGCIYIIRFGTMRRMHKAAAWARLAQQEALSGKPFIFWNIWVMLAMPAVWLTWSLVFFLASIMMFVWRAYLDAPSQTNLRTGIAVSCFLGLGVSYLIPMVYTFSKYGETMDEQWRTEATDLIRNRSDWGINVVGSNPEDENRPVPPRAGYYYPPTSDPNNVVVSNPEDENRPVPPPAGYYYDPNNVVVSNPEDENRPVPPRRRHRYRRASEPNNSSSFGPPTWNYPQYPPQQPSTQLPPGFSMYSPSWQLPPYQPQYPPPMPQYPQYPTQYPLYPQYPPNFEPPRPGQAPPSPVVTPFLPPSSLPETGRNAHTYVQAPSAPVVSPWNHESHAHASQPQSSRSTSAPGLVAPGPLSRTASAPTQLTGGHPLQLPSTAQAEEFAILQMPRSADSSVSNGDDAQSFASAESH